MPLSFTKYLFQQFYYKPVPGRIVLASAARLEISKGAWLNLLLTDRLRAGGANTVRGYSENSLDIRDFVGFSGGRTALLILNQEIRFPIFGIFRGGVFFDHGSLFTWLNGKSEHAARSSTGFGLRITTPFLLLRIDYGIPLNRQPGDPFGRWYFAIGQAF